MMHRMVRALCACDQRNSAPSLSRKVSNSTAHSTGTELAERLSSS